MPPTPRPLALLPIGLAALACSAPAWAETQSGIWTTVSATTTLPDDWSLYGELVVRSEDRFDGVRQVQLRGIVTRPVAEGLRIGVGYVRSENSPKGRPNTFENTAFPEVDWDVGALFGGEVTSRTRLEFRLRSDGLDTSYRLRQLVRFAVPLGGGGPKLRLSEEAFFELADTGGRDNSGYSASRLAAGVQFPLSKHLTIEPGYLAEINRVRSGADLTRHLVNLTIATKF